MSELVKQCNFIRCLFLDGIIEVDSIVVYGNGKKYFQFCPFSGFQNDYKQNYVSQDITKIVFKEDLKRKIKEDFNVDYNYYITFTDYSKERKCIVYVNINCFTYTRLEINNLWFENDFEKHLYDYWDLTCNEKIEFYHDEIKRERGYVQVNHRTIQKDLGREKDKFNELVEKYSGARIGYIGIEEYKKLKNELRELFKN